MTDLDKLPKCMLKTMKSVEAVTKRSGKPRLVAKELVTEQMEVMTFASSMNEDE